jgi:hypothetical protein
VDKKKLVTMNTSKFMDTNIRGLRKNCIFVYT